MQWGHSVCAVSVSSAGRIARGTDSPRPYRAQSCARRFRLHKASRHCFLVARFPHNNPGPGPSTMGKAADLSTGSTRAGRGVTDT